MIRFGYGDANNVVNLGHEFSDGAHPSTGQELVWIQSFSSLKLVSIPKLKSPIFLCIYPKLEEE